MIFWYDTDTEVLLGPDEIKAARDLFAYVSSDELSDHEALLHMKLWPDLSIRKRAETWSWTHGKTQRFVKKHTDTNPIHMTLSKDSNSLTKDTILSHPIPISYPKASQPKPPSERKKERTLKGSKERKKFKKPKRKEVHKCFYDRGFSYPDGEYEGDRFFDHYETCGWVVGKNKPMKDWKAAVRQWIRRLGEFGKPDQQGYRSRLTNCSGCNRTPTKEHPVMSYMNKPYCDECFDKQVWRDE